MTSPTRSITVLNLQNKYGMKDQDKFSDVKKIIRENRKSIKISKEQEESQHLGEQFMDYINLQRTKKMKALALKKQQQAAIAISISSAVAQPPDDESDAVRNVRVQKAVEKIKSKLKNQSQSRDQKFENKFSAFSGLSTFVDVRVFLQNLNSQEQENLKNTTTENIPTEIIEASENGSDEDENAYIYKDILVRSKEAIIANKGTIDQIRRQKVDKLNSGLFNFLKHESSEGYQGCNDDEKIFYKYIDQILDTEVKQQNMTIEKQRELDQIKMEKQALMAQFHSEIENQRQIEHKKLKATQPMKLKAFMQKSKKILQLLEKTTNHIFKKLTLPQISINTSQQSDQSVSIKQLKRSLKFIKLQQDMTQLSTIDEKKPYTLTIPMVTQMKQSTIRDVKRFKDQIEDSMLLKRGVSLYNLMDMKKFVFDNSQSLEKVRLPKLQKGLSELYDTNKRVEIRKTTNTSMESKSPPQQRLSLKDKIDTDIYHFSRYTTSTQVVQQRNQLSDLIKTVDKTQLAMKLELPIYKCEMTRFEDELNQAKMKFKPETLESLSYFSKSERSDARLVPKKRQPRGIQIL